MDCHDRPVNFRIGPSEFPEAASPFVSADESLREKIAFVAADIYIYIYTRALWGPGPGTYEIENDLGNALEAAAVVLSSLGESISAARRAREKFVTPRWGSSHGLLFDIGGPSGCDLSEFGGSENHDAAECRAFRAFTLSRYCLLGWLFTTNE